MPSLILGTAGHIDHGKTQLIKALTGTDTDRLAEEKKRGISIELGFANLKLPSGRTLGVVDVPGHERFVKNMVAGATGIDIVLLVVAADDGVMPQTREHLAIIDLLGIERGVVAITKSDLADEEWIEMVTEDVRSLIDGSSLAGAPIVAVSSKTGQGLEELAKTIDGLAEESAARPSDEPFRLPVDRVFTMSGAGTVITGTLWSGSISADDEVEILPARAMARARSVQVHGAQVEAATAGQRVALNLAGVPKDQLRRGDVLQTPGYLAPSRLIDAELKLLPSWRKPLVNQQRVHVHHGTSEILARVVVLGRDEIKPGESGFVQLKLEDFLATRYGDKFILRSYSPTETMGGGIVLDSNPARHRRRDEKVMARLEALRRRDADWLVATTLDESMIPLSAADVALKTQLDSTKVEAVIDSMKDVKKLNIEGKAHYWRAASAEEAARAFEERLLAFHKKEPRAVGIDKQVLKSQLMNSARPKIYDAVLAQLATKGVLAIEGPLVRHPTASAGAMAEQVDLSERLVQRLRDQGVSVEGPRELAAALGKPQPLVTQILGKLTAQGAVVKLAPDLFVAADTVQDVREKLAGYLTANERIKASEFRDLIGASRKYAVPMLEYFDSVGLTRRDGDFRVLK